MAATPAPKLTAQVTVVDLVIIVLVLLMALQGFARGFLVGATALAGFIAGAYLGSRIAPLLLSGGSHSPYAALFSLGGAVLARRPASGRSSRGWRDARDGSCGCPACVWSTACSGRC